MMLLLDHIHIGYKCVQSTYVYKKLINNALLITSIKTKKILQCHINFVSFIILFINLHKNTIQWLFYRKK